MWNPYIKLLFLLFIITTGISQSCNDYTSIIDEPQEYLRKSDLIVLLKSLEKLIQFTTSHIVNPSLDFVFGIFLISVNLEKVLIIDNHDLGFFILQYMTDLLETNNRTLNVFIDNIAKLVDEKDMEIFAHMNPNVFHWANRIYKFSNPSQKQYVYTEEQTIRWEDYKNKISNYESAVPSPKMSDKCLASISHSRISGRKSIQCKVDENCYYIIRNGTNVGYALTHRLLPFLIARIGQDCSIFSLEEDARWMNKLCSDIYIEAMKIAQHNYFNMDLLMEQIALCSLNGHALFFRRLWFAEILKYQNKDGCFSNYIINTKKSETKGDLDCGEHVTAVAGAALSAAIRFVVQNFY